MSGPDADIRLQRLREEMVEAGRRMYERRLVVGLEGNLSARVDEGRILATPAGRCKGDLLPHELVLVDPDGRPLGDGRPSTELAMHLAIYGVRDDVDAVVHGHPPYATAHAVAGRDLDRCLLPEVVVSLGSVPVTDYGTPSTPQVADAVRARMRDHDAVLLRNHGAVVAGRGLLETFFKLETVEQLARISLLSDLAGGARPLSAEQVEELHRVRGVYGLRERAPACRPAERPGTSSPAEADGLSRIIAEEIARALGGEG